MERHQERLDEKAVVSRSSRTTVLASLAAFILAAGLRIGNASAVFVDGVPQLSPFDELYHFKRIAFSAEHFPRALEFDPDRGIGGAFCPWPPLYDVLAGGIARLLGGRSAADVLAAVVWIPPLLFSLAVAATFFAMARAGSPAAALLTAFALATSPFMVTVSWIGEIDHHHLEPPLTFAIVGTTLLALHDRQSRKAEWLLAAAITTAVFVQTALIVACGLAFVALFLANRRATVAFLVPAAAIVIYRLTRLPGYPDSSWFLGWPHAALFVAAAVALTIASAGVTPDLRRRLLALAAGGAIALIPASVLEGLRFFAGDPWLSTIAEFQPLTRVDPATLASYVAGFSGGLVLVWLLLRRRDPARLTVAGFAIVYLILAVSSRRFILLAIPLLALAGALAAEDFWRARKPLVFALAAFLLAVPPPLQLALWWRHDPPRPIAEEYLPYIRAATFLRAHRTGERLLAPWSLGHLFDVVGATPVVVDNFGTMSDRLVFQRAYDAFLETSEPMLARYCHENGIRWIAIQHPIIGLPSAAAVLGLPRSAYVRDGTPTTLARRTWWWRAFFTRQRESAHFRLVFDEPQLRIWQRID